MALALSLCLAPSVGLSLAPSEAFAQNKASAPLPLKRVRLYETGVGYFERTGAVNGGGSVVTLPVPAGHLDDALKTLVVLSKDGKATVSGIEFGSSVSRNMARALASLPNGGEQAVSYHSLLTSMKGANVEVRTAKESIKGRLIEVLQAPANGHRQCEERTSAGKTEKVCVTTHDSTLLLVTGKNEVRRFRSGDVSSVRPTERGWRSRVDSAIDALSQHGASSALNVQATPGQPVTLGYVTETPVWRSTYRLVLDSNGARADRLQGWALLHNDTDEDWKKVRVELVNGRPDSFLFPLAAPRYTRRELVTPQRELSTVPQLLDKTVDNMWSVENGSGGLGLSGVGEGGGGYGYGVGLGRLGAIGHGASAGGPAQSSLLAVGNLASLAKAKGVETGALFRYALDKPIDLRAHGSALLPFVNDKIEVTHLTYFDSPGAAARAGVHIKNATQQTFPAGPISIFGDGGFAGETALSRTKPGEERILRFGFDLDLELEQAHHQQRDEPRVLRFHQDVMTVHFVRHHTTTYNLINRSSRARKVYLQLGYVSNADVKGADSLAFDQERKKAIAVFASPAAKTERQTLEVREGLSRTEAFKDLTANKLRALAKSDGIPSAQRVTLRKAAAELETASKQRRNIPARKRDLAQVEKDISRLRDNLRVLKHNARGTNAMLERLLQAEKRVAKLRREIDRLQRVADTGVTNMKRSLKSLNGVESAP
jgi:hypothetical protein